MTEILLFLTGCVVGALALFVWLEANDKKLPMPPDEQAKIDRMIRDIFGG